MDTIYIAVIVILIGVCIFAFMRPPNCPTCPVCPEPTKCPACPAAATCPTCPTCPDPRFGLRFKPVNDQVKQLIEKAQSIFVLGQESACSIAKGMYAKAKEEFTKNLKTEWSKANPAHQTCDFARTEFAKSVDSAFNSFVQNATKPQFQTVEVAQPVPPPGPPGSAPVARAVEIKQISVTPSPFMPSPADMITIATKVKPLIVDIGNHVISMICDGGKMTPDKIVQMLDDVFNSLCY